MTLLAAREATVSLPSPGGDRLSDRDAWVVLAATDGVGPEAMAALIASFGSASDVLAAATSGALRSWARAQRRADAGWLSRAEVIAAIEAVPERAQALLGELDARGLWTVTPLDGDYPPGLRDLDPPPPLLVGSGARTLLSARRSVAIVGTRRPTPAGRALAASVAKRLVECGAVVVSGLAVGIDGVAHATALDRGGQTVGVIGGGHDHPGPRAHAALRAQLVDGAGAVVSEYPPHVQPTKGTYPRRNRIIAALAQATLVIEAPRRSGALITASDALVLGRPVFVAPGRVGEWATAGSLALLRDAPARVIAGVDELIEDLGLLGADAGHDAAAALGTAATVPRPEAALASLNGAERAVAERVRRAPAGLDALVNDTGLPPSVVSGAVTLLLIRGWLQPVGPAYVAAGPLLG